MQEERFEVFFQNISGLYRAVQRLRVQFADAAGVSSVHLFWLYLLREYPEGLAASRLAEQIAREALSIQNRAGRGILPEELAVFYRVLGALNQNFSSISITGGTYEERTDHS